MAVHLVGIIPVSLTGTVWLVSSMYPINVSTVEIRFWVKGENLSGDSDTSLFDFAESGE
jgi:hypothetical protein